MLTEANRELLLRHIERIEAENIALRDALAVFVGRATRVCRAEEPGAVGYLTMVDAREYAAAVWAMGDFADKS